MPQPAPGERSSLGACRAVADERIGARRWFGPRRIRSGFISPRPHLDDTHGCLMRRILEPQPIAHTRLGILMARLAMARLAVACNSSTAKGGPPRWRPRVNKRA